MSIIIRKCTLKDHEAFSSLMNDWGNELAKNVPEEYIQPFDYKTFHTKEEFEHCYYCNDNMNVLVAEDNEEIIALLVTQKKVNGNTHPVVREHSWVEIIHFYCTSKNLESEIFSLFIEQVKNYTRENTIKRIYFTEAAFNQMSSYKYLEENNFMPLYIKMYLDS